MTNYEQDAGRLRQTEKYTGRLRQEENQNQNQEESDGGILRQEGLDA